MAWLIGLLIVLAPVWLDEEPEEARAPLPPAPRGVRLGAQALRSPLDRKFRAGAHGDLDRPAFLATFARQAGAELLPCLREIMGPRGSIALTARLNRRGELSAVNFLVPVDGSARLACARLAIEKMSFTPVATRMSGETLEIEWRFDW